MSSSTAHAGLDMLGRKDGLVPLDGPGPYQDLARGGK
jgi:hypothetical protein